MKFKDLFEAAAAKKPAAKKPLPDYVYHAVSKDNYAEIQKSGLLQKNRLRMVFHDEHGTARAKEPGGVLLRVKRKGMPDTDSESVKGEHRTKGNLTPGRIEVYHPYKGWSKLKSDD